MGDYDEGDYNEWRSAVAEMDEAERAVACGHFWRKGVCVYCGEEADGG